MNAQYYTLPEATYTIKKLICESSESITIAILAPTHQHCLLIARSLAEALDGEGVTFERSQLSFKFHNGSVVRLCTSALHLRGLRVTYGAVYLDLDSPIDSDSIITLRCAIGGNANDHFFWITE